MILSLMPASVMMRAFRVALQFLTRTPTRTEGITARDIAASYYFYPVIGFAIGVSAVVLRYIVALLFPVSFSIVLVLVFLVWITGGLHEDGLADVADGIGGGWTPSERLSIMKDGRIGAFGAVTLVLAVLAKYAALTSLSPGRLDAAIVTAQILGRWAFLPLGYFNSPACEGLGSQFVKGIDINTVIVATVLSSAMVILVSRTLGAVAFCSSAVVIAMASFYFRRKIGGVSGDCFGATFQFVEVLTYATFLA
jgi:adenosylcobinamide-GDP ribazoletransferase